MTAEDRQEMYRHAVYIAQIILGGDSSQDEALLTVAAGYVRGELESGRRNQDEWPVIAERMASVLNTEWHSMKVRPALRLVSAEEFEEMVDAS